MFICLEYIAMVDLKGGKRVLAVPPPTYTPEIQVPMVNPAISSPPKSSPGTNGGGLTRSDCIHF